VFVSQFTSDKFCFLFSRVIIYLLKIVVLHENSIIYQHLHYVLNPIWGPWNSSKNL